MVFFAAENIIDGTNRNHRKFGDELMFSDEFRTCQERIGKICQECWWKG